MKMTNDEYKEFAGQHAPRSRTGRNMLRAFVSGGAICAAGQALTDLYLSLGMEMDSACAACSVTLIFIGALLGAFIIPLLPAFFHGHVMLSPGAYTAGAVLGAVTAFAIQYNILDVRGAVSRSMNGGLLDILGPSAIVLLGIWIILHSVRR